MNRFFVFMLLLALDSAVNAGAPELVPQPVKMEVGGGAFLIAEDTRIIADGAAQDEAAKLADILAKATGYKLKIARLFSSKKNLISLELQRELQNELGSEGYKLHVALDRIDIRAAEPAGLFHGIQTLRQLLPVDSFSQTVVKSAAWSVPCVKITDFPRFGWRGLLIDPARHFIPKDDLLRFIDAMAMHKFNRLQVHFTDDQGWRIEIKKYPGLTEIGSKMDYSRGRGGFYTAQEIREIVQYARERHITIVPEIEMPAHTGAAIVSYPEIGMNSAELRKLPAEQRWERIQRVLAPRPDTVTFMQNVLMEVMDLFPSKYIHIGGDEANTNIWQQSEEMQTLMKEMGHEDVHELHSWFIKQMDAFLTKHGRRMVGWDEILQGGLAEGATVMSWRGMDGGITAARAGHDVVMAPTSHTYFDYYQGPKEKEPRAIGGFVPVEKVYQFEPVPRELTAEQAAHVLGGQGQLWGEFISNREHREYMAFPRACALSEVLWSPQEARDLNSFLPRLNAHLKRLQAAGVNYRGLDEQLIVTAQDSNVDKFDYFVNNWNVVGLKDYLHGARITPDNQLVLSGKTPVQIRYGRNLVPFSREQGKLAMHGWMPIMQVNAFDGPVRYEVSFWATPLPDVNDWKKAFDWPTAGENFLNWISIKAVNTSDARVEARVEIKPRTGAAVATRPQQQAEPKTDKTHARQYSWSWQLEPKAAVEAAARYTFFPVDDPEKYDKEDAGLWLQRTEDYWRGIMERAVKIEVPCKKATDALLAAHVCQLIANDHGELHGGEDFYDVFYIRDGAYQVMELEEAGFTDAAAKAVELYLNRQRPDGRFESQQGQFDANGQAVWVLWQYYMITRDRAFLERVYPRMVRAVRWTMQARRGVPEDVPFAGLLPNALADGECLWDGQYHIVGYDLWNLRGMLCTADAARILGKEDEAKEFREEAARYRTAIDEAWKKTGVAYLPPSWEKVGTHWGNTETLWPTELFDRDDPRVAEQSRFLRQEFAGGFIEGTIQWKGTGNVEAIHPYMGAYTVMNDLVRGRHEQVVQDFYWYLLHSTAAHAFPEGIYYKKRMAWNHTIPHVTGACNYAIMLRHMLVHEAGDELHLLKAVPDWWLDEGQEIRVERAPTHFGEMDLVVRGTKKGVDVMLDPPKRNPPQRIVLTLPESRPLHGSLDGVEIVQRRDQKKRWDFPTVVALYGLLKGERGP